MYEISYTIKTFFAIENLDDGFLIAILPNILQIYKMKSD